MKLPPNFSGLPSVIHAIALAVAVLLFAVLRAPVDATPPPLGPFTPQEILEIKASIGKTNVEAAELRRSGIFVEPAAEKNLKLRRSDISFQN